MTALRRLPPEALPLLSAVNYPALTDGASRFIGTLTRGIPRVIHPASQRRSHPPGVSPTFHRESPSFSRFGGTDIFFCDAKRFL